MPDRIDRLLARLRGAPSNDDLSALERAVWTQIEREADGFRGRSVQVQIAAACGALLLGLAMAQIIGFPPMPQRLSSERVVLSDDASLMPSVRLEGGT
jgi:hypothetical protein